MLFTSCHKNDEPEQSTQPNKESKKIAEVEAPAPVLYTRAYRSPSDLIYPYYYYQDNDPFSSDDDPFAENGDTGSIKAPSRVQAPDIIGISSHLDQCIDIRRLFEVSGVFFPEGSWCLFNRTRSIIIAHTDATNHDIIRQLLMDLVPRNPLMLKYTFLHVSIPNGTQGHLTNANTILSNREIRYHYTATSLSRSGEKSIFTTAAPDSSETDTFEIVSTLGEDGSTLDARVIMKSDSLTTQYYHLYRSHEPQVLKLPTQKDPNRNHYIITRADIIRP